MTDEMRQAIAAELLEIAEVRLKPHIPDGAMTIDECLELIKDKYPNLGRDRAVLIVQEAVQNGKLKFIRVGARKYYYKV